METHDLHPEMQGDDWMTAYQGGSASGEVQGALQLHLQEQLQLL